MWPNLNISYTSSDKTYYTENSQVNKQLNAESAFGLRLQYHSTGSLIITEVLHSTHS